MGDEMIRRESLQCVVQGYFNNADEKKVEYITDMIACQLEIAAYNMIREVYILEYNKGYKV